VAVQQAAIAKITEFEGDPALDVSDYLSAGVTSFSPSLIAVVNSFMAELSATQSQTLEQIQAVSDAVNALRALADGTPGTGPDLTSQDLAALGFSVSSSIELALLNSLLDRLDFSEVDSHEELAAILAKVRALIASAGSGDGLSTQDFLDLGFANMTAEATDFLNERIAATADDGSGINSISIFLPQGWDGSEPLEQLTMSIHARILYSGQQLGFAVEQGGRFWIAGLFSNTASWELYTMALTATDFMLPFGVDPASQAAHPDFAAGAAPIRFGFHATNTTLPNWGGGYAMGRYSAFSVSFVPAPGVLAVLGGVALGRQRRTR
jgi:hypothetical protein